MCVCVCEGERDSERAHVDTYECTRTDRRTRAHTHTHTRVWYQKKQFEVKLSNDDTLKASIAGVVEFLGSTIAKTPADLDLKIRETQAAVQTLPAHGGDTRGTHNSRQLLSHNGLFATQGQTTTRSTVSGGYAVCLSSSTYTETTPPRRGTRTREPSC